MALTAEALGPLTEDTLLGGRVRLLQPERGYRVSTDAVLLAAAVPARAGQSVLELGSGGGGALLCLAARVEGLSLEGLEREWAWPELAAQNAHLNGVALQVHLGDVSAPPGALKRRSFDHVMANPPYYPDAASMAASDALRDRAHRADVALAAWVRTGLARLRPGGWLTMIQRTERLPEILSALVGPAGDVSVLPLAGRRDRDAKRVIVRARKGVRGPFRLAQPFVLHAGAVHVTDGDDFTPEAAAVLREGAGLPL